MASLREKKVNGKIVAFVFTASLGRDTKGKQIRRYCTWYPPEGLTPAKRRRAAELAAATWECEVKEEYQKEQMAAAMGVPYSSPPYKRKDDFVLFVEETWCKLYICNGDRKKTTEAYYQDLTKYITSYFKGAILQEITPVQIQSYLQYLRQEHEKRTGKPLSAKYLNHQYGALKNIFGYAERIDFIVRNPMKKVDAPKIPKVPVEALTQEQAGTFLANLSSSPIELQALLNLLLSTGIRRGELLGLKWKDIDKEGMLLNIERGVAYTPQTGIVVSTPKTKSSIRAVPLLQSTLDLLAEYEELTKLKHPNTILKEAFVFPNKDDLFTPKDPSAITKIVRRYMKQNGLPLLSTHDLRHSFGSLMIANGADVKSVQAILGHSDAGVTLNYYVRTDVQQMKRASDKLAAALGI